MEGTLHRAYLSDSTPKWHSELIQSVGIHINISFASILKVALTHALYYNELGPHLREKKKKKTH